MAHMKGFLHVGLPFLLCLLVLSSARDMPESFKHTGTEIGKYDEAYLPQGVANVRQGVGRRRVLDYVPAYTYPTVPEAPCCH